MIDDINKRLYEIFKALKELGFVKDNRDFCKKIKYNEHSWGLVKAGARKLPDEKINLICSIFKINKNYIINGKSFMFKNRAPIIKKIKTQNLKISNIKIQLVLTFIDEYGIKNNLTFLKDV